MKECQEIALNHLLVAFIILKIHLTFVTCILYNFNYTFKQYVYNLYTYNIHKLQFEHVFIIVTYFKITGLYTSKLKKKNLAIHLKKSGKHFANLRSKIKNTNINFFCMSLHSIKTKDVQCSIISI